MGGGGGGEGTQGVQSALSRTTGGGGATKIQQAGGQRGGAQRAGRRGRDAACALVVDGREALGAVKTWGEASAKGRMWYENPKVRKRDEKR